MPHPKAKNIKRQHRLVVKPDYQGIGIGSKFSNYVADELKREGYRVTSTTSSPSLMFSRKNHNRWKLKLKGRIKPNGKSSSVKAGGTSGNRITTTWEFV